MSSTSSKYSVKPSKDLKLTYWLGAGASFNSIPILKNQSSSMMSVGKLIKEVINSDRIITSDEREKTLYKNDYLFWLSDRISYYANKAEEFGSIDTYARRLWLLKEDKELHNLRECISIYFMLWEICVKEREILGQFFNPINNYELIDKRYISLMSILLNKTEGLPALSDNVNFLTWNYDLQLEKSFQSFLPSDIIELDEINRLFPFKDNNSDVNKVIHLNGHFGYFEYDEKQYPLSVKGNATFIECLLNLLDNNLNFPTRKFKKHIQNYDSSITYAWEMKTDKFKEAINIMKETEVLVVIGYSFPAFNRSIDTKLIRAFEDNTSKFRRVVYQDPNATDDIVDTLFTDSTIVSILDDSNPSQFYIPHEFLYYEYPQEITL